MAGNRTLRALSRIVCTGALLAAAPLAPGPAAAADVVIDEQPTDAAIVQRLADLEARARANPAVGAVGFARPYPATLLRLSPWLGTLAAKGITLVPVSALARDGAS